MDEGFFGKVYRVVCDVPRGSVTTYGQVASMMGASGSARTVGWALRALPRGSKVPWHRVVNAQGKISLPSPAAELQRVLLESEGISFRSDGAIDLARFGWTARDI